MASETWHRLHPSTLLLRAVTYARRFIVPAIIVFVLARARETPWEYYLLIFFVPAIALEMLRYFTLRYKLGEEELVIRRGLISRHERHVPFARIQNINLVQGILHRWFGVADVTIETAGGSEPEAVLKVLSVDAVAEMRRRVFRDRPSGAAAAGAAEGAADSVSGEPSQAPGDVALAPPQRQLVLRLSLPELVKLGLISARGTALLAVVFAAGWELDLWERIDWTGWIDSTIGQGVSGARQLAALLIALVAVPVIAVLSVVWSILRFYDFRLEIAGEDLHVSGGLFTRRSATVPRQRIQVVSIRESILHRLFGRVSVRIETAAGVSQQQEEEAQDRLMSQRWFIPLVERERAAEVLRRVLPRLDLSQVAWHPLAPGAVRRMMARNTFVAIVLGVPVAVYFWPWGLLAGAAFIAWGLWHAHRSAQYNAWAHTPFGVMYRSGVVSRAATATFAEKVQVVAVHASPFDRRRGMATLEVDTAGAGPAGHRVYVRFLPRQTADALAGRLVREVERPRRPAARPPANAAPALFEPSHPPLATGTPAS